MDDPLLVRRFKCFGNLPRDGQGVLERDRTLRDAIRERRPFDQLQYQRARTTRFLEAVNRGDVWMIQRGEELRFALEAGDAFGVGGEERGQSLDRDVTA